VRADHRVAMSLAVAGSDAVGSTLLQGSEASGGVLPGLSGTIWLGWQALIRLRQAGAGGEGAGNSPRFPRLSMLALLSLLAGKGTRIEE